MGKRALSLLFALLLFFATSQPVGANTTIDGLTNQRRAELGLRQLRTPDWLNQVARRRAHQIRWNFVHDFDWTRNIRGCYRGYGENIMYRIPAAPNPARYAFRAFWNSPTHRVLMVGHWTVTNSAVYIAPNGGQYVVQLFVLRCT